MDILNFSRDSWRSDPEMRIEDAYKWLFHATRGGEHAVRDEEGPRRWLDGEWATLTAPLPHEPMVTPLRPDSKIVRLNLRPFRAKGGEKEALLQAFISSARQCKGQAGEFSAVWHQFGESLRAGPVNTAFTHAEWLRLDKQTKPQGYPAIEHSAHYRILRKPAYRVLRDVEARSLLDFLAVRIFPNADKTPP